MKVRRILNEEAIKRVLRRMANEIAEFHQGDLDIAMVGIRTAGVYLAQRLVRSIKEMEGVDVHLGVIDVTLYRDDISKGRLSPLVKSTDIPFAVDERKIILVDDVLFTGRTTRAAMDALMDFGRPSMIQLAVLIDRGHRELPIKADYVGLSVATERYQSVIVHMREMGKEDEVIVITEPQEGRC